MEKREYCSNCNEETEYIIRDEIIGIDLGGDKFTYAALIPYCSKCGNEVHVAEINDLNVIRAYKAHKEMLEKK